MVEDQSRGMRLGATRKDALGASTRNASAHPALGVTAHHRMSRAGRFLPQPWPETQGRGSLSRCASARRRASVSWSRWNLGTGVEVLGGGALATTLYLVIQRQDGVYLERIGLEAFRNDSGLAFERLLDRRVSLTGSYNAGTGRTTLTLPYAESGALLVMDGLAIKPHVVVSNTVLTVAGDYHVTPLLVGKTYEHRYTLSELFVRESQGNGGSRAVPGKLMLRSVCFEYERSGFFKVEVTPRYQSTTTYELRPVLGQYTPGDFELRSGEMRVPVAARSSEVVISIVNDSPYPSRITGLTFEGEFVTLTSEGKPKAPETMLAALRAQMGLPATMRKPNRDPRGRDF